MTAYKCPDIKVTVVDLDAERIHAWHTNHLPIYEPGLLELIQPARDGIPGFRDPNLFFSTDISEAIAMADLIFLCVPTPTKLTGTGAGMAADMVYVEAAARMIAEVAEADKIVVEKSTVPCRTAENIGKIFAAVGKPGVHFDILSNPEFLAEGSAVKDLLEPDRVLIGSMNDPRGLEAAATLASMYHRWIHPSRIITMNLWSSEMAKLSANALLAQRISSINALSAVCEATGADIDEVSHACGLDDRIGSRMLKSSVGFGGSCFKKDVFSLVYIAETLNLPEVAAYWKGIVDINEYQKDRFIKRIVKCLFSTLTNKKVAILGYAYKKNTGDTRESAAISIVNHLLIENATVSIYDPKVKEAQIWRTLRETNDDRGYELVKERVSVCQDAYGACYAADAVVIATEWDEFSNKTADGLIHITNGTPSGRIQRLLRTSSHQFSDSISRSLIADTSLASSAAHTSLNTPLTDMSRESSTSDSSDKEETAILVASVNGTMDAYYPGRITEIHNARSLYLQAGKVVQQDCSAEEMAAEDATNKKLDWSRIAQVMKRPMFVFDGRNIVNAEKLARLGFWVEGIGKAGVAPKSA